MAELRGAFAEWLEAAGLTQREVSERLEVSQAQVSAWAARRALPGSASKLIELSALTGISIETLIRDRAEAEVSE